MKRAFGSRRGNAAAFCFIFVNGERLIDESMILCYTKLGKAAILRNLIYMKPIYIPIP